MGQGASQQICVYCAEPRLALTDPPEHVIPSALGAELTTDAVCAECNAWAGVNVDQPFLADDYVRIHRSRHQIEDRRHRGKRSRNPFNAGFTEDGIYVEIDDDWKPRLGGRIDETDTQIIVTAGSMEEAERLKERALHRYGIDEADAEISIRRTRVRPRVKINVSVSLIAWARMAAKIALAASAIAFDDKWRNSAEAVKLRRILRGEIERLPENEITGLFPQSIASDGIRCLAVESQHVIYFSPLSDGTSAINVILFGDLFFALRVDSDGRGTPSISWRMDPHRGLADELEFDELAMEAVLRLSDPEPELN